MKVLTLSEAELATVTRALARSIVESGFGPDLVVGIRTGGEHVARIARKEFPGARLVIVQRQRATTRAKRRLNTGAVLRRLPYWITDRLRIFEHRLREREAGPNTRGAITNPLAVEEVGEPLDARGSAERRILVIDDAVDSGQTMADVFAHLSSRFPHAEIRTFAISQTMAAPAIIPDYVFTNYGTLIRFFWSEDYHASN